MADQDLGPGVELDGRYQLERSLGSGAMGVVFAARDRQSGQTVAVKVLRAELVGDDRMRRRVLREAAALKACAHPSVLPLIAAGVDAADRAYLVTPLMHGQTLSSRLGGGSLSAARLAPLLLDACEALGAMHEHGIVHGDITPGNLFVTDEGGLVVFDFGASKIIGLDRLTATGELTGTPRYMAPEILTGSRDIDARADLYSLGVVAYEALSGRCPFEATHPGRLLVDITRGAAVPLDDVAQIDGIVSQTVHRAMSKNIADRYADASTMAQAVARWT